MLSPYKIIIQYTTYNTSNKCIQIITKDFFAIRQIVQQTSIHTQINHLYV